MNACAIQSSGYTPDPSVSFPADTLEFSTVFENSIFSWRVFSESTLKQAVIANDYIISLIELNISLRIC